MGAGGRISPKGHVLSGREGIRRQWLGKHFHPTSRSGAIYLPRWTMPGAPRPISSPVKNWAWICSQSSDIRSTRPSALFAPGLPRPVLDLSTWYSAVGDRPGRARFPSQGAVIQDCCGQQRKTKPAMSFSSSFKHQALAIIVRGRMRKATGSTTAAC